MLFFFKMMMEADFQLFEKWLKVKQAEKRASKWNLSSKEWFNQTEKIPSRPGDLLRRKESIASFRSARVT